jgi:Xaa-Pro dipeptidase
MSITRRTFLNTTAVAAGGTLAACAQPAPPAEQSVSSLPEPLRSLKPMTAGVVPITDDERRARMEKARQLMVENRIDAVFIEPGTSLFYFTGIRWSGGERMFGFILPAKGDPAYVVAGFEEDRARELIKFGDDIRRWEEDESPAAVVAGIFKDRGIRTGTIGMEERVRFFLYDNIRKAAPAMTYVSADPVTAGCRMVKSPAELALMQKANDITYEAFRASIASLKEGMTPDELTEISRQAHELLGATGSIDASFGLATSFPHGSVQPQRLKEGDTVLMDGGCGVDGYRSDITRTTVFGTPSDRQREIWELERKAQDAALAAVKPGVPCEAVDAAARKVITDYGFGPDYKVPGLPHRTGHGIGLDGHEWPYLVRGNTRPLAPGMCFSDEPMIVVPGEFGIRLEDDFYVTEDGAKMFTRQAEGIDRPIV